MCISPKTQKHYSDEVQSELVPATQIKQLFLDNLTPDDAEAIRCDVIAAATRSPSVELAVLAILFHTGLHALVCYRAGHRLWNAERTGLAKYLQSTVSGHYSADIHPACSMGQGIYLCSSAGVGKSQIQTIRLLILHPIGLFVLDHLSFADFIDYLVVSFCYSYW